MTTLKIFLYDIWYWLDDAISRVAALIILWVLFIIISTRYTKKYWNNIVWELSLVNLKNNNTDQENETKKTEWLVNEKIKDMDVSDIKSVQFIFSDKTINIRAVNLIKIVQLIIQELWWITKFEKNQLRDIYTSIKDNYKTELSKTNYDKIIEILEKFVEQWWEVKMIKKED